MAVEPVSPDLVAQARSLVTSPTRRAWRLAPQWAAAAAAILVVPLLVQLGRNLDRGVEGQGRSAPSARRMLDSRADVLQVFVSGDGGAMDAGSLQFRWTAVAGSPYYDVRIVTDDGTVVVRERVTGTAWQPPPLLRLGPGAEYFVHVAAYPGGDKAVSSDHIPFKVSD